MHCELYNTISAKFLSDSESDIPMIHSPESMKKTSCNRKQSTNNTDTTTKQLKKIKTNAKLPEETSKPIKLYLLRNDNLAVRVRCEEVKRISEKESIFGSPFFELCTVL